MKIIVNEQEAQEVQAIIDVVLKSAGFQSLQIVNKMLSSIEIVAQEGIETKKTK